MININLIYELRDKGYIQSDSVSEQEYMEYEENKDDKDYVIIKFQVEDQYLGKKEYYEKFILNDLDENYINLLLKLNQTNSLKNIEKYIKFFYYLTILSIFIFVFVFIFKHVN